MMAVRRFAIGCALVCVSARAAPVAAQLDDGDGAEQRSHDQTASAAREGALLFLAQPANLDTREGVAVAFGGYDGALGSPLFESAAEVKIIGPFALRGSALYSRTSGRLQPSVGGKAQILRAAAHGVNGTVGLFYRPEGLTEPEGEVEGFVALGRSFGANYFTGNLFYGQDPEGSERDGEVRLAGLRSVGRHVLLGLDSRLRFDLGSDPAKLAAHGEATFDLVGGPVATLIVGRMAIMAEGGASVRRVAGATARGAFATGGVAMAF